MILRQAFLSLVALGFIATALTGLLLPQQLAAMAGLGLQNASAVSEIRSNYGGMHLALGGFLLFSALTRKWWAFALLLIALFTGGYAFGRLLSLFLDGPPNAAIRVFTLVEMLTALIAVRMLLRPATSADTRSL